MYFATVSTQPPRSPHVGQVELTQQIPNRYVDRCWSIEAPKFRQLASNLGWIMVVVTVGFVAASNIIAIRFTIYGDLVDILLRLVFDWKCHTGEPCT